MAESPSQNATEVDHSSRHQLVWPNDYVITGHEDGFIPLRRGDVIYKGELYEANTHGHQSDQSQKGIFFRPEVTVNVYNTGGSSTGGSGSGGSGSVAGELGSSTGGTGVGGNITLHEPYPGPDFSLRDRLKALEEQVNQLSLAVAAGQAAAAVVDTGMWNTTDVRSWQESRAQTEARINFSKTFKSIPTVIVSLCSADSSYGTNFRFKIYATAVDMKGFTIHADTWSNTQLYSCGVSWVAIG